MVVVVVGWWVMTLVQGKVQRRRCLMGAWVEQNQFVMQNAGGMAMVGIDNGYDGMQCDEV